MPVQKKINIIKIFKLIVSAISFYMCLHIGKVCTLNWLGFSNIHLYIYIAIILISIYSTLYYLDKISKDLIKKNVVFLRYFMFAMTNTIIWYTFLEVMSAEASDIILFDGGGPVLTKIVWTKTELALVLNQICTNANIDLPSEQRFSILSHSETPEQLKELVALYLNNQQGVFSVFFKWLGNILGLKRSLTPGELVSILILAISFYTAFSTNWLIGSMFENVYSRLDKVEILSKNQSNLFDIVVNSYVGRIVSSVSKIVRSLDNFITVDRGILHDMVKISQSIDKHFKPYYPNNPTRDPGFVRFPGNGFRLGGDELNQ